MPSSINRPAGTQPNIQFETSSGQSCNKGHASEGKPSEIMSGGLSANDPGSVVDLSDDVAYDLIDFNDGFKVNRKVDPPQSPLDSAAGSHPVAANRSGVRSSGSVVGGGVPGGSK